jgi:hypothetical protein
MMPYEVVSIDWMIDSWPVLSAMAHARDLILATGSGARAGVPSAPRHDVFRYAWFTGHWDRDIHFTSLLAGAGELTELGRLYLSLSYTPP